MRGVGRAADTLERETRPIIIGKRIHHHARCTPGIADNLLKDLHGWQRRLLSRDYQGGLSLGWAGKDPCHSELAQCSESLKSALHAPFAFSDCNFDTEILESPAPVMRVPRLARPVECSWLTGE